MNEITNIHLGRTAFVIAVDAHRALRAYLHAIGEQVDENKEVLEEIELRMAELLTERGISGKKVAIMADIDYLKEQLGEPADFGADEDHAPRAKHAAGEEGVKRLFRDTDNAVVAGVSSGLAAYFGIDPIIIRLMFVVLTISGGAGIVLYGLLWLLVPAAQSESDRLKMRGKPVTVENIKAAVDEADVPGAANRVARLFEKVFTVAAKVLLGLVGIGFILAGIALVLGAATAASIAIVHGFALGGHVLFPIGTKEHLAVFGGTAVLIMLGTLAMMVGRALIRRKWGVPSWLLAGMVAVFIAGGAIGAATSIDAVEPVRTRFEHVRHVENRTLPAFSSVDMHMGAVATGIESSGPYGIEIRSIGSVNTKQITTHVRDGRLVMDASRIKDAGCTLICPYGPTNVQVIIHAPQRLRVNEADDGSSIFYYGKNGELLDIDTPAEDTPPAVPNDN
jgi:phage shock protein PspC (stress-responsive transcriptional regulator)